MNRLLLSLLALLLLLAGPARAQFGSFGDVPIEINAEETRFEGGIAVAERNVLIRYGDVSVYSDFAQYNPDTRDLLVLGNVRIYQAGRVFAGERAIYNLETKQLTAADVRGESYPAFFSAEIFSSLGPNAYQGRNVTATTSDNSKPDYSLHARSVRIYPKDRVIFRNVYIYLGNTPVFWVPFVYQNLNREQGFTFSPGYSSSLGAFLRTRYTFPLGDNLGVTLRLDLMSDRGVGAGFDAKWAGEKHNESWGRFRGYIVNDSKPETNPTSLAREPIDPLRYRLSFQDRTYLTEDIYSTIDINKLSDARFLQDFEPGEFKTNPNPDNVFALTKWDEDYTVTLTARKGLNDFFDFTEELPELALDIKRQPLFHDVGLFYDGENSAGYFRRNFASNSLFADYDTYRFDSFHQLTYPKTLLGWLSVVPRLGLRGTYYGNSGHFTDEVHRIDTFDTSGNVNGFQEFASPTLRGGGAAFRTAVNAGLETSFKLSRAYESVQSRAWGLDGLRHVFQPYANFSYVWSNKDASELLQFDRINPSTRQPPIDFPQFNSIDSIESWNILRLGAHNRLQTRRDNTTFNWLELNTFVDIRFQRPEFEKVFLALPLTPKANQRFDSNSSLLARVGDPGTFSNLYNQMRWSPVPWIGLQVDTQLPIFDEGFDEVNTTLSFLATSNMQFTVSHRYLSGNKLFLDSNQLTLGTYVRLGENWGINVRETYEFDEGILQSQRYELSRDLSSWIASLGFIINNNGDGKNQYGIALTFTLKDLPLARLPFNLDPSDLTGTSSGTGKNP